MSGYSEALKDPNVTHVLPGIIMRPFHQMYGAGEQDYHVYCSVHDDFGFCGTKDQAEQAAKEHIGHSAEPPVPPKVTYWVVLTVLGTETVEFTSDKHLASVVLPIDTWKTLGRPGVIEFSPTPSDSQAD